MTLPFFELGAAFVIAVIIYRVISVYTSPLSKIPNAGFGAAFSRLAWAFPQEYNGTITLSLPKLHERLADFSFGTTIGAVDFWAGGKQLAMVEKNDEKATWMPVLTNFPLLCEFWQIIEQSLYSLTGLRTKYSQGLSDFQTWSRYSWQAALSADSEFGKPSISSPNLIQTLCNAGLPAETALSEASENLGPGTDTTSATLAHIIWALAHNPSYQDALYQDLASVSFATDMTKLENIPRLQACVEEGIRWAGAAAAMLPRIVPPGGIELHGTFIPEGTMLTSSPIWYLHDTTAYPNPKLYDPYRWLSQDGRSLTQDSLRDRFYIPFSRGANICLGAHFSHLELYVSVSQFVRNFRFEPRNPSQSIVDNEIWNSVLLPERKEWVAAVTIQSLQVVTHERG
ncbi:cytochrome P450 monooxygenase [Fusarium denticulatum]|uniref:Cytochrome P450 monooxygenase n=1 Tax=Fusarium denticulatum TaxID=48507 RepID=A0A8H5U8B9_9HYPO|nr:cytochrome P450 monooxygenase [Fusarium denticulatum]